MQAVFEGKEYVKVNVNGELNLLPQPQEIKEELVPAPVEVVVEKVEELAETKVEEVKV